MHARTYLLVLLPAISIYYFTITIKHPVILYSALIWRSSIFVIGDLRSRSPLLKLPIINAHAHSNAHVHQIAKLKTGNYIFMG